ncbi:MAG: Maf family nucleotide pyrophosphatase [Bacteroidia bacterium]
MKLKAPLILASGSPRRSELLSAAGLDFEVLVRNVEEFVDEDLAPRALAVMLSEHKGKAYDDLSPKNIVITADTLVSFRGKILNKPADEQEAIHMLEMLSGNTHLVVSGVSIFHKGKFTSFAEETKVTFRKLRRDTIEHYVSVYRPFDKAGGYGIQEWIGMVGISGIEGDYYNVMGLPVARLYEELRALSSKRED